MNRRHTPNVRLPDTNHGYVLISVTITLLVVASVVLLLNRSIVMTGTLVENQLRGVESEVVIEAALAHIRQTTHAANCIIYPDLNSTEFPIGSGNFISGTVSPSTGSPVDINVTVTMANGANFKRRIQGERVYSAAPTLSTFQPAASDGKDTFIQDGAGEALNFGSANVLHATNDTIQERGLMQFDLSTIAANARVESAVLDIEIKDMWDGGSDAALGVHRVTRSWAEGVGGQTGDDEGPGANWLKYESHYSWATAGGDYVALPEATIAVPYLTAGSYGHKQLDVTTLAQNWVMAPDQNFGVALVATGFVNEMQIWSSDTPVPARRPKLTVTWRCECGSC